MHNVECPVKCRIQSTMSTIFKDAYHPNGYHSLYDKSVMHGVHQMGILTQTKPIASVLSIHSI